MSLSPTSRVVRKSQLPSSTLDEEIVILNLPKNAYVGLDEIGRRIWELLETPHTADELCAELARRYEGSPEQIRKDVLAFLEELHGDGLIELA
jgi:hypothetical protein